MTFRRADVFFYGLFMDEELLRAKGLKPEGAALAAVDDLASGSASVRHWFRRRV